MKQIEDSTGLPLRRFVHPVQQVLGAGILAAGAVAMIAQLVG